jgi:hypothetical protein
MTNDAQGNDLHRDLGRMEGKLDAIMDLTRAHGEKAEALSKRLSVVEGFQHRLMGIAAAVGAVSAYLYKHIEKTLS